jgi:hypothetical protein
MAWSSFRGRWRKLPTLEDIWRRRPAPEALAAAEVVAALAGRPAPDLPEEVRRWVGEDPVRVDPELQGLSLRAVDHPVRGQRAHWAWAHAYHDAA